MQSESNRSIILSNVTLNMLPRMVKMLKGVKVGEGFNNWIQYVLNPDAYDLSSNDQIFIILDGESLRVDYPDAKEVVSLLGSVARYASAHQKTKIYLSNIQCNELSMVSSSEYHLIESYEAAVNTAVTKFAGSNSNIVLFPLKQIILCSGLESMYSDKMKYMSSCPYSMAGLKKIADNIAKLCCFRSETRKKCLILDMDNTLWGGAIGEEGVDGIELSDHKEGARFYDFQKRILEIKKTGIILAVVSKNNLEDVLPVFNRRDMLIKKDDLVALKLSWEPKSVVIRQLATDLNIGLDSMVFVDDNPIEREEVKREIPDINVPEFPTDTTSLSDFGLQLYNQYFYTDRILDEDIKKTAMYQANAERGELRRSVGSLDDFIKSLNMNLVISIDNDESVPRVAQMTQKTNQFNETTRRYSEADIEGFMQSEDYHVITGKVSDRFGDNGIVVLCIVKLDGTVASIDEFLMSCRVMGRKVEYEFLKRIETFLAEKGYKELKAEYIPTAKNSPASEFYSTYGFKEVSDKKYFKKCEEYSTSDLITVKSER